MPFLINKFHIIFTEEGDSVTTLQDQLDGINFLARDLDRGEGRISAVGDFDCDKGRNDNGRSGEGSDSI